MKTNRPCSECTHYLRARDFLFWKREAKRSRCGHPSQRNIVTGKSVRSCLDVRHQNNGRCDGFAERSDEERHFNTDNGPCSRMKCPFSAKEDGPGCWVEGSPGSGVCKHRTENGDCAEPVKCAVACLHDFARRGVFVMREREDREQTNRPDGQGADR